VLLRGRSRAARPSPRVDRTRPTATSVLDGWPSPRWPRGPGEQNPAYARLVCPLGLPRPGLGYFGEVFDRPSPEPLARWQDSDGTDLWATGDESRDQIIAFYRRTREHSDATIDELREPVPVAPADVRHMWGGDCPPFRI
jgi:hypothetical protein